MNIKKGDMVIVKRDVAFLQKGEVLKVWELGESNILLGFGNKGIGYRVSYDDVEKITL